MSYVQQILSPDPIYLQPDSYAAQDDRRAWADFISPGVVDIAHYAVSVYTGMQIQIDAGAAWIAGQNVADQGLYRQYVTGNTQLTVTAAHASLPRLDQVILRVLDNAADGSGANEARIEIVPGTPTAGATLDNRAGAANLTTLDELSKSVLLLCDVLVPAQASSLTSANLRDKRPLATVKGPSTVPIGSVWDYAGTTDPSTDVIISDGRAISRFNYAVCFGICGTAFGPGDGSTTFNVPDYRGKTGIGVSGSHARGSSGGAESVTLGATQVPIPNHHHQIAHDHAIQVEDSTGGLGDGSAYIRLAASGGVIVDRGGGGQSAPVKMYNGNSSDFSQAASASVSLMQPWVAVNKVIRIR